MKHSFTFIMNSDEIGETIEQFYSETLEDAWKEWAVSATSWIMKELHFCNLVESDVLTEILGTEPQLLPDLNSVWLADFCVDFSVEVIQVVVVGNPDPNSFKMEI